MDIRASWVDVPDWFVEDPAKPRAVHVYRTSAWREAVIALASEDDHAVWPGEPVATADSDLIVTVIGGDVPVVASVELARESGGGAWAIRDRYVLYRYVAWSAVKNESGQRLIEAIVREMESDPSPAVSVGDCLEDEIPSDIAALRMLRVGAFKAPPEGGVFSCGSCEREIELGRLRLHDTGPVEWGQGVERTANRIVEQLELVCDRCHELLHPHSLTHQRQWLRPECAECGRRGTARRIVWGDVSEPLDPEDEEDYVLGGGALPGGPVPTWACAACGTTF